MSSYIEITDLQGLGYDTLPPDNQLTSICSMASSIADNFCLQSIGSQTTEEIVDVKYNPNGNNKLFPSYLPVIKINSISKYYDKINSYAIDKEYCDIDNRLGCILLGGTECGKIKINYDHGYETIPDDAKRAVISIAANLISDYKRRKQFNLEGVSEITDDKQKVKFFDSASEEDIPQSAKSILLRYRKIR